MKTATEKYNAVLEGKMAKQEFVRQMRQQFPNFVSQFNGFEDSVQILKNRGMIFEVKKEEGYKVPELNLPLDVIERGVDAELEAAGIDSAGNVTKEQYLEAKRKAMHNLKKDMNHYLNLMAGESSNVDKNDKMKEVKKGEEKDVLNGMKKAELKEDIQEIDIEGHDIRLSSEKQNIITVAREIRAKYGDIPGFNKLLKDYLYFHMDDVKSGNVTDPIADFDNYIDANYDSLNEKEERPSIAFSDKHYDKEAGDKLRAAADAHKQKMQKLGVKENYGPDMAQIFSIIEDRAENSGFDVEEEAMEVMEAIGQEYEIDFEFGAGESRQLQEKKAKKDYDGDGKIESGEEEYKGSKDKAIKAAMGNESQLKEAVKTIIKKVLTEEVVNEAATARLAQYGEEYSDFEGVKQIVNQLENIVTEVESFYDRINNKVKDIFAKVGEVKNEEGLKVGGFIAPSIEAAFRNDLKPVQKTFLVGIELPKVRTISQADIARVNAGGELEEEPKQNVFAPVYESNKK